MPKRNPVVFPAGARQLVALGERLELAGKRRRMTQHTLASRAGISIPTLRKLERGHEGVSVATFLRILPVLGLAGDIERLEADGEPRVRLQEIGQKGSASRRR